MRFIIKLPFLVRHQHFLLRSLGHLLVHSFRLNFLEGKHPEHHQHVEELRLGYLSQDIGMLYRDLRMQLKGPKYKLGEAYLKLR